MPTKEEVLKALEGENLEEFGLKGTLRDITKEVLLDEEGNLVLRVLLPKRGAEDLIKIKLLNALGDFEDLRSVKVEFFTPGAPQPPPRPAGPQIPTLGPGLPQRRKVPGVKRLVLVGSGKGGVGKSTVAVNLAAALKERGFKVGLLDADVYGPSAPTLLGLKNAVVSVSDEQKLLPVEKEGLKVLSIGFMLPSEETPVVWRGALLMKAIQQFLSEVDWGELDYLVVDLPPGTGDVQLTLAQNALVDGALVVTTPQDVALVDVKKAVSMFEELGVPVLGLVENMAYFVCPECGKRTEVFGRGRVSEYASKKGLPLLVRLPLEPALSELSDRGEPVVWAAPESETAKAFLKLADELASRLPVR
ncbi:MAG: Mrp/NBP35 family ATP-binding protein [Aquificae bacterium]|nr:Mrp/NBP35 family ATP-binding protein [Aquificota bacterium]